MDRTDQTTGASEIGARIAATREEQGLEQKELAQELGISGSALCKIEKGQRGLDSLLLYRIAAVLDRPLTAFFPSPAGDEELALARQGTADDEAMQGMADWSVQVLGDLDFTARERARL